MLGDERNMENGREMDAYTQSMRPAPGRAEENSVSFSYYTPPRDFHRRDTMKKRRRSPLRILVLVLALVAVLFAAAISVLFFLRYDVEIDKEDGVLNIRILPDSASAVNPEADSEVPALFPDSSPEPTQAPEGENPVVEWDGTKMELFAPPSPVIGEEGGIHQPEMLSYSQIYAKCAPSVVVITAEESGSVYNGTGIILSEDGYIITCSHLVTKDAAIRVTLENGDSYEAVLVGQDDQSDLAVLKVEASGLPTAEFGNSSSLQVGAEVIAIGNPMGQVLTMTNGIISAIDRNVEYNGHSMTLLQTNAAINEGNSGGPLINRYGQVIGITNMKMMSYYTTVEGIGFAIPAGSAKPIVDELMEHGYIAGRPAIGIQSMDIPKAAAAYYKLPAGVLVEYVFPGTDAYDKGLARGDVITEVDGQEISSTDELDLLGFGYKAGDQVTLTVYRGGTYLELTIVLCDIALLDS